VLPRAEELAEEEEGERDIQTYPFVYGFSKDPSKVVKELQMVCMDICCWGRVQMLRVGGFKQTKGRRKCKANSFL